MTTTPIDDGYDGYDENVGSLRGVLLDVRAWLARFIAVTNELDLDVLTLWAAHTHAASVIYTTPRLIIDSAMPSSGKTTVLEHLQHLCFSPLQAASISSVAMIPRMLDSGLRTLLIDEADRSLDPKHPEAKERIALINSGYKRGASRPVLVPVKGDWELREMPTFSPVAMAGNAPQLPDDTRSRSIRILLMPDFGGTIEDSDWEENEDEAAALGVRLQSVIEQNLDGIRTVRPTLPEGCVGRIKERWSPLARIASIAGGPWPVVADELIKRDIAEAAMEREDGLMRRPPAVSLLMDLQTVWPEDERFIRTTILVQRVVQRNADEWGDRSRFGSALTTMRFARMISQAFKIYSSHPSAKLRGYARADFETVWARFTPPTPKDLPQPSQPSQSSQPPSPHDSITAIEGSAS